MFPNKFGFLLTCVGAISALVGCGDDTAPEQVVFPGTGSDGAFGDGDYDGDPYQPGGGDGASDGSAGGGSGADGSGSGADGSDGSVGGGGDVDTGELPAGEDYNGWTWVETPGSKCRDGSPAGYYYRVGQSADLVIFLNGGGACADKFFCGLNPVNVNQDLPIEQLLHGAPDLFFGVRTQRQAPPDEGIFKRDPRNPVGAWSMVFVPYCTGDIHSGVNENVTIPDVPGTQQFVGYTNFGLFLDSFGPAFSGAKQVLLTGSSAGGFGSLTNFDRVQEYFNEHGGAQVTAITDSGVPMPDKYMAPCLQKKWRTYWGLDKLPVIQECGAPCMRADGGGLTEGLGQFMFKEKYAGRMLGGAVSTVHDEIIRAFFAPGQSSAGADQPDDCTQDPGANTVIASMLGFLNAYPPEKYQAGLKATVETFGEDQLGYYVWPGTLHMHIWRADYYSDNGVGMVMADWVADILAGKNTKIGTL